MHAKSIAESSKGSILQYFQPSLSYQLLLRSLFYLFLSGCFTQVLLYLYYSFRFSIRFFTSHISITRGDNQYLYYSFSFRFITSHISITRGDNQYLYYSSDSASDSSLATSVSQEEINNICITVSDSASDSSLATSVSQGEINKQSSVETQVSPSTTRQSRGELIIWH